MRLTTKLLTSCLAFVLLAGTLAGCNRGPTDEVLAQNVNAKLKADPALASRVINVTAASGAVTLTGSVNSEAEKTTAGQLAQGVDGVKSVINNLTVRPPVVNATPPPVSPDTKLKADVEASLAKYGITGVTVGVVSGEVTLTGDIARAKLQDAMKAANEAHPKKVLNKMNIK